MTSTEWIAGIAEQRSDPNLVPFVEAYSAKLRQPPEAIAAGVLEAISDTVKPCEITAWAVEAVALKDGDCITFEQMTAILSAVDKRMIEMGRAFGIEPPKEKRFRQPRKRW